MVKRLPGYYNLDMIIAVPWQEITKIVHYWLEVNALSAPACAVSAADRGTAQAGMKRPMLVWADGPLQCKEYPSRHR